MYIAIFAGIAIVMALIARQSGALDRHFLYFPQKQSVDTPASVGLDFEEVYLDTGNGERIHGWYVPAKGRTAMLWLHGNAGNIGDRLDNIAIAHDRLDVNILVIDYRGYGKSGGRPSERAMYEDAEAALTYLREVKGYETGDIVLFGRSLGGAVAAELASRYPVRGLILESTFTSVPDMARRAHPVLSRVVPPRVVLRSRYDSLSKIGSVESPLLVIHGDADELIPVEMGRTLYESANAPKQLYVVEGGTHNDTHLVGGESYYDTLRAWLNGLGAGE
jgi:hypothetical protein